MINLGENPKPQNASPFFSNFLYVLSNLYLSYSSSKLLFAFSYEIYITAGDLHFLWLTGDRVPALIYLWLYLDTVPLDDTKTHICPSWNYIFIFNTYMSLTCQGDNYSTTIKSYFSLFSYYLCCQRHELSTMNNIGKASLFIYLFFWFLTLKQLVLPFHF